MAWSRSQAYEQEITNGYMTVTYATYDDALGYFTLETGDNHPVPNHDIFYDGWTSYISLLDYSANRQEIWAPLYYISDNFQDMQALIDDRIIRSMISWSESLPTLEALGTSGFRTVYTLENFDVTQDVFIMGANLEDTFMQQTVTVRNVSPEARYFGLRMMWDYMISENDDALFRTRYPDAPFTPYFMDFIPPCFAWYEMSDDIKTPTFTVFGTALGGNLEFFPTPPDEMRYSSWSEAVIHPWSFSNTGGLEDSAIVYYWGMHNAIPLSPGESMSFTQFVTTAPEVLDVRYSLDISMMGPEHAKSGDVFEFVLTVRNSGDETVYGVTMVDTLPASLTLVSATGSPEIHGNILVWRIPEFGEGEEFSAILRVREPSEFKGYEATNAALASFWVHEYCPFPPVTCSAIVTLIPIELYLRVFPNPFDRDSAVRGTVKFEGIVPGTRVRIYTVRGLKVWEGVVERPYLVEWDGTNEAGKPVAPGIYIWIVESADTKQKGTLIVR